MQQHLRGRVDLEKYNSSLRAGENIVILKHGGATARPSMDFLGAIKNEANPARIVPFIYSNDDTYALEFGSSAFRFWKNGALVESSPGVPYELAHTFGGSEVYVLDFVQSGDTMIMARVAQ